MSSEESGDDYTQTQTQTQRRGRRRDSDVSSEINDQIKEDLVAKVVRYILLRDAVKLPFRRDDLTKEKKILSEYKKAAGLIIQEAAERIYEIYRMTLTEVEGKKNVYILVNEFSPSEIEEFIQVKTASQKSEYILLMTLLSLIEISNGKLDTEKAIEGMKKIGFHHLDHKDKTDKDDWWVDIIKKDFKSQLYVHVGLELYWKYIEQVKDAGHGYYYTSGYRSKIEIGRMNVHKFIAKCFGDELDEIREKEIEAEIIESEAAIAREAQVLANASKRGASQSQVQSQQATQSQTPVRRGGGARNSQSPSSSQTQSQTNTKKRGRG